MKWRSILLSGIVFLGACGGGGSGGNGQGSSDSVDTTGDTCIGQCADAVVRLTVADVKQILGQALHQAQTLGASQATIAVVDRVGNVLAVHQMGGGQELTISTTVPNTVKAALDGLVIPKEGQADTIAAIAKAVTGAYLSSEGNAFTTRTANQIVQEHFNPGERNQPSGPLFGVQFSQLACSDFTLASTGPGTSVGPHRSPLGLSADPGGMPLYKEGTVVGGIGVMSDGLYSIDKNILNNDRDQDEMIAAAGTFGFAAPKPRRADRVTVEGKTFRYADVDFENLPASPEQAPAYDTLQGMGMLVDVNGYGGGTIIGGTAFGQPESGIRPAVGFDGLDAFTFVDDNNNVRFPPTAGGDAARLSVPPLTANEVETLLKSALAVANRSRAQIRTPQSTPARVTVSVVDSEGRILGMIRTRDAPIFGSDVSLQKARTATFFSSKDAAQVLTGLADTPYVEIAPDLTADGSVLATPYNTIVFEDYVKDVQAFVGVEALTNGIAFADRSGGNLSRPFYPDGIRGNPNGPLSKSFVENQWSVFSSGLQLDLSLFQILQHVIFALDVKVTFDPDTPGDKLPDVGANCLGADAPARIANGIQIFPGSVPIFRGDQLVGGIGVSGDGIDQDDMISFLGLHEAGELLGGSINNAPKEMRADTVKPKGERLRFVQCPQTPYIGSSENFVCAGK